MKPEPTTHEARERLAELARAKPCSLAALSRMIWKNDRYLDRYVRDGYPERLPTDDIRHLAAFFGVTERELGLVDEPPTGGARAPIPREVLREALAPVLEITRARGWYGSWKIEIKGAHWHADVIVRDGAGEFRSNGATSGKASCYSQEQVIEQAAKICRSYIDKQDVQEERIRAHRERTKDTGPTL